MMNNYDGDLNCEGRSCSPKYLVILLVALTSVSGCKDKDRKHDHYSHFTTHNFNKNWQFARDIDTTVTGDYFLRNSGINWESASLPHTAHLEPLVIEDQQWQGTAFYRKFFEIAEEDSSKHIAVKFGAAMHEADVYLNGEHLMKHKGGYVPFVVNISDEVHTDEENVLLIKLNNEDNSTIPPGKPVEELDFNYFSGLYRNVYLHIDDKLHISDPIEAGRIAGGGLRIHYTNVSDTSATVNVQTDIANLYHQEQSGDIKTSIIDSTGMVVARIGSNGAIIPADSFAIIQQDLTLSQPKLWSPDRPYLYTLKVDLYRKGTVIDSKTTRIGVRTISIDDRNGFMLNDEPLELRGTNRHQSYPYIGYALSDNAQYRDAYKIKQAGFNFVRTAHYPPSPAFLAACDELGLLFMDAIPGWQFFGGEKFQQLAFQNIRNMIRRDRNHPSIVIWEASLNESAMNEAFMDKADAIVHEELPFNNIYSSGWKDYAYDIFISARQHAKPPAYWNNYSKDKPIFIAEYGDWEYYAQNAGFNQDDYEDLREEERSSRQLRGKGQKRLAQQALNFQESHNSNLQGPSFGDANWLMYDYNRGYDSNIEASGISDIFRIPKFAYYFYRSQAGPNLEKYANFGRPMIYIANFWSDSTYKNVKVYSNTEEVELYINGELVARQLPDSGRNSSHLKHPPFTFKPEIFKPGTLKAVGYINGEPMVKQIRRTPGQGIGLQVDIDKSGKALEADQKDVVFVYASVIDSLSTVVPQASKSIHFSVEEGDAKIIGDNPIKTEAGVATVLLQIGDKPGEVIIKAEAQGLKTNTHRINIQSR